MTSKVNRTLLRRSGTLNMFRRLASIRSFPHWARTGARSRTKLRRRRRTLAVREGVPLYGGSPVAVRRRDDGHGPAGGLNRRHRRSRESVRADPDSAVKLAPSEDLDEPLVVHEAACLEALGRDLLESELVEHVEVDDVVLDPERVGET